MQSTIPNKANQVAANGAAEGTHEETREGAPGGTAARPILAYAGWALCALLAVLICRPMFGSLWYVWQHDQSLSHGPLVPLIALGLLWMKRDELQEWRAASFGGLALFLFFGFLFTAAEWADVEFLSPLSLVGMIAGGICFFGGKAALKASIGALGFLVFMIPWPTSLVERLAFPLQLTSSAYSAMMGGMIGLPIHRDGVNLAVMSANGTTPIYSVIVAQACSGLTSLMVLLALSYLIAYFTPIRLWAKAVLVGTIVPIALLSNSIRLTIILFCGGRFNASVAQWVHDHEGPVLIFFCSIGLLGIRQILVKFAGTPKDAEADKSGDGNAKTIPPDTAVVADTAELAMGGARD